MVRINSAPRAGRNFLNKLWDENPEPIAAMIEDALRDVFLKCGGRPELLHVTFREPHVTDTPNPGRYHLEMCLSFDAGQAAYEVAHDDVVRDFHQRLNAAWLRTPKTYESKASTNAISPTAPSDIQLPGHLSVPQKDISGSYNLLLRHHDLGMIAGVVNRLLRSEHLETVDTRLMQLDMPNPKSNGFFR